MKHGEIVARSFESAEYCGKLIVEFIPKHRAAESLKPVITQGQERETQEAIRRRPDQEANCTGIASAQGNDPVVDQHGHEQFRFVQPERASYWL